MIGNGGNDKLIAGDYQDTLDGGPGNDVLNGGFGNDTITGGPGQDTISGDATERPAAGTPTRARSRSATTSINARDGEADTIDCGVGNDRAVVDAIDVVANCETVDAAGAPATGPGAPAGRRRPGPAFTGKLEGQEELP